MSSVLWLFVAAAVWGVTNPFLKKYSSGLNKIPNARWYSEVAFLLSRPLYLATQVLNLLGSVAFFWGLRNVDVSIGSTVANSTAFVITALVSTYVTCEQSLSLRSYVGVVLVLCGVSLCTCSKSF